MMDKTEARLARIETRVTRMMLAWGMDPHESSDKKVFYGLKRASYNEEPAIDCSTGHVTLSQLLQFAHDNDIPQTEPLHILLQGEHYGVLD